MCDVQSCPDVTESAGNALQASGANAAAIFGGDSPPLSRSDTRVRRIPFPTRCKPLATGNVPMVSNVCNRHGRK